MATATRRDSAKGRTYQTPDGEFASVTSILACLAKPALVQWAANTERESVLEAAWGLYDDAPAAPKMSRMAFLNSLRGRLSDQKAYQREMEKAADIGTQAHKLIEWNLRHEIGHECGPQPRVRDEAMDAFAEYEAWRAEHHVKPLKVEQTVWHKALEYAGTLDLLAEVNGELAVVDFKTSKGIYPEYRLQVAAYAAAVGHMGHPWPQTCYVVRVPKIKGDHVEACEVRDWGMLLPVFQHLVEVYKWQRTSGA